MKHFRTFLSIGFGLLASTAHAQQVDYSGLEKVYNQPVTTSAIGEPQRIADASVSMQIITADQIRRSGADTIPQILGRIAGVTNWQETRESTDVGIRGQNSTLNPTLLVLVNGRQVYLDSYGYTDWSLIPVQLEEIKQIEVVKGPNTALFGFNAATGVVNIITFNPLYDNVDEAGIKMGTGNFRKAHFVNTMRISDKISTRLSGSTRSMDQYSLHSKTGLRNIMGSTEIEDKNFNWDTVVKFSPKTSLRLEASYANVDDGDFVFYVFFPSDKETYSWKTDFVSDTDFGVLEANIYQNNQRNNFDFFEPFVFDNRITIAQLKDIITLGSAHTLRFMSEYRHNTFENDQLVGRGGATVGYDGYAGSAMWDWDLAHNIEVTNAFRLDHLDFKRSGPITLDFPFTSNDEFSHSITDYSINSGIVWKATPSDVFRLSYARGLQFPSLSAFGQWGQTRGPFFYDIPNIHLKPVTVNNYELAYNRDVAALDGQFNATLFHRDTRDVTVAKGRTFILDSRLVDQAINLGSSATQGLELGIGGKWNQYYSWDASYTYQNTIDDFLYDNSLQPINYQDTAPHHVLNAHIGWAKNAWEVDLYSQATSSFKSVSSFQYVNFSLVDMSGYFTSGGRIAYAFDNGMTLALSGVDISQRRVANGPGLENDRQLFLSASKQF